jgi:hypothetical protein
VEGAVEKDIEELSFQLNSKGSIHFPSTIQLHLHLLSSFPSPDESLANEQRDQRHSEEEYYAEDHHYTSILVRPIGATSSESGLQRHSHCFGWRHQEHS